MAKTLREELQNIFDRFNEFTALGERNGFDEDIGRFGKLMFAKQISDAFKPKEDKEKQRREVEDWLKKHLAAASVTSNSKKVDLVPNWNGYVRFVDSYKTLLKRLILDINKLAKSQKWLDEKSITDSMNKVDLRQLWVQKEKAAANLNKALAQLVKTSYHV